MTFVQNESVSSQDINPKGLFFKPDGSKVYIIGQIGDDINEYSLSTPWDISTMTFVQGFDVSSQDVFPNDLFFKPDGSKVYIIGTEWKKINEYQKNK